MKRIFCILLVCTVLYAGATSNGSESTSAILEAAPALDGGLRYVLEKLLGKLDRLDRKLLDLQAEMNEHREEVERNRVTNEQKFSDILRVIAYNRACATTTYQASRLNNRTSTTRPKIFTSCKGAPANASGVYLTRINNASAPLKMYCEMEKFGGGWIVVQHRFNGSVDFNRNWTQYRQGFGALGSEFWLGLEHIHQLTTARTHELLVEMEDFYTNYGYARYSAFQVGSESEQYNLKTLGSYTGTAGDSLIEHKGNMFSTNDRDNDGSVDNNYAVAYEGAWWHGGGYSNLNGRFINHDDFNANWWFTLRNDIRGMSFSRMMIREL